MPAARAGAARRSTPVREHAAAAIAVAALAMTAPRPAGAQSARASFFLQMVRQNSDPRVRLTAAVRLGELRESDTVPPLLEAYRTESDATVLATLVATFGAIGDPRALPVVQSALRSTAPGVSTQARRALPLLQAAARAAARAPRGGPEQLGSDPPPTANPTPASAAASAPRYLVGVGSVTDATGGRASAELSQAATEALRSALARRGEVVLHSGGVAEAQRTMRAQRLRGHYFDANVQSIEPRSGGVRATVSVVVTSYPGRIYEFESQTSITVSGSLSDTAEGRADAVRRAMESAAGRAVDQLNQGTP